MKQCWKLKLKLSTRVTPFLFKVVPIFVFLFFQFAGGIWQNGMSAPERVEMEAILDFFIVEDK